MSCRRSRWPSRRSRSDAQTRTTWSRAGTRLRSHRTGKGLREGSRPALLKNALLPLLAVSGCMGAALRRGHRRVVFTGPAADASAAGVDSRATRHQGTVLLLRPSRSLTLATTSYAYMIPRFRGASQAPSRRGSTLIVSARPVVRSSSRSSGRWSAVRTIALMRAALSLRMGYLSEPMSSQGISADHSRLETHDARELRGGRDRRFRRAAMGRAAGYSSAGPIRLIRAVDASFVSSPPPSPPVDFSGRFWTAPRPSSSHGLLFYRGTPGSRRCDSRLQREGRRRGGAPSGVRACAYRTGILPTSSRHSACRSLSRRRAILIDRVGFLGLGSAPLASWGRSFASRASCN